MYEMLMESQGKLEKGREFCVKNSADVLIKAVSIIWTKFYKMLMESQGKLDKS